MIAANDRQQAAAGPDSSNRDSTSDGFDCYKSSAPNGNYLYTQSAL